MFKMRRSLRREVLVPTARMRRLFSPSKAFGFNVSEAVTGPSESRYSDERDRDREYDAARTRHFARRRQTRPLVVLLDEDGSLHLDGWHRLAGAIQSGRPSVRVRVLAPSPEELAQVVDMLRGATSPCVGVRQSAHET